LPFFTVPTLKMVALSDGPLRVFVFDFAVFVISSVASLIL